jgi:hypothetical protein
VELHSREVENKTGSFVMEIPTRSISAKAPHKRPYRSQAALKHVEAIFMQVSLHLVWRGYYRASGNKTKGVYNAVLLMIGNFPSTKLFHTAIRNIKKTTPFGVATGYGPRPAAWIRDGNNQPPLPNYAISLSARAIHPFKKTCCSGCAATISL